VALQVIKAGRLPGQTVDDALRLTWNVAHTATVLSGSNTVVLRGTVDQRGGDLSYDPLPANGLVLLSDPDIEIRIAVATFEGDLTQDTPREFFLQPHNVDVTRITSGTPGANPPDGDDFACTSVLTSPTTGTRNASGALFGGFTFSFTATQTASTEFGQETFDFRADEQRDGTMTGPGGLSLSFSDDASYRAVAFDNVAEDLLNTISVSGTAGGRNWRITNGLLKRTFSNFEPVQPDFWNESAGTLTRDDVAFGVLGFNQTASSFDLVLTTPAGDAVLETFACSGGC
jgi:hypothetical protein